MPAPRPNRRDFTRAIKAEAFQRAEGRCEHVYSADGARCNKKLFPGDIHYDHVIPHGLGGTSTIENCACLCKAHHGEKTARLDVPRIAKADRQHDKHIGAVAPSRNPVPGGRRTRFRKRMNGQVERRT